MGKIYWMRFVKIAVFILCFVLIFACVQEMFRNIASQDESNPVKILDSLPDDMDALFLGASQMFCTVNADKLTEEFNITSFDFGASDQPLPITYYYLQEAKKHIRPKLVAVEVTKFFQEGIPEGNLAGVCMWNYGNMPLTVEKCQSIQRMFPGDVKKLLTYTVFSLLESHFYWNQMNPVIEFINLLQKDDHVSKGFTRREHVMPNDMAYLGSDDGPTCQGSEDAISAIYDIVEDCRQNGAEVLFFKAPTGGWTRNQSKAVKAFMEENQFTYLEMHDYLQEIGIDADTDFYDSGHLNISGANKATDFLAKYLLENYGDILGASNAAGAL